MNWEQFLETETNKLKVLLQIERYGLPESVDLRIKILKLLNAHKGYPVRYTDLIEWMPIINDYWSLKKVQMIASNIKNPTNWETEILKNDNLSEEDKALMLFALPL